MAEKTSIFDHLIPTEVTSIEDHSPDPIKPVVDDIPVDPTMPVIKDVDPEPEPVRTPTPTPIPDTTDDNDADYDSPDDRAQAIYEYLTEIGLAEKRDQFTGSPKELQEVLDGLPVNLFNQLLQEMHPVTAEIVDFAIKAGTQVDIAKVKEYFESYVEPTLSEEPPFGTDGAAAYRYLETKLKGLKIFNNERRLQEYLDGLVEDGAMLEVAQTEWAKDVEGIKAQAAAKKEEYERQNATRVAEQRQIFTATDTWIEEQPWLPEYKARVRKQLDPAVVQTVNEGIYKSPAAIAQLAEFYTHFDPKTGKFDLSSYATMASSKQAQEKRENLQKASAGSMLNRIRTGGGKETPRADNLIPIS